MKPIINFKNSIQYFIGVSLLSFAVLLSFRTGFGATPVDNLTGILSILFEISLGTATLIVSTFFIAILIIYFKNFKFLFLYLQVLIFSPLIDFWDLVVFTGFYPEGWLRIVTFIGSVLLLPIGGMLLIKSTYPAGIYDELMFLTYRITRLKINVARTLNELTIVMIAILLSYSTKHGFGTVGYGTIIYAVSIGPLLKIYLNIFDMYIDKRRKKHGIK